MVGCQSVPDKTSNVEVPHQLRDFPYDVKHVGNDIVDIQLSLKDRNLYMARQGNVKLLSTEQCNIDMVAHRGDFREPENSLTAITHAVFDNFNTVEIDVMQIKSGLWVNHHDLDTGRSVVHYSGKSYNVRNMSDKTFSGLRLRDKDTHRLLDERPITAYESFVAFAKNHKPSQVLNVEIKSKATGTELAKLDAMLRKIVGDNSFYYSSLNLETLTKLRGINSNVYLGFIQGSHPRSIAILKNDLRRGIKNDELYKLYSKNIEAAGRYGTRRYARKYKDYTSSSALNNLQVKLGSNSGLHLDIRSYTNPNRLKRQAHLRGMKVYTYSINGSDYHQRSLLALNKSSLPDGIIIDATPYRLCQQLYTVSRPLKRYKAVSTLGQYITNLPQDADFDELEQMLSYINEGYYVSISEGLKRISEGKKKPPAIKRKAIVDFLFPTIKDEDIDTSTDDAILIKIPSVED